MNKSFTCTLLKVRRFFAVIFISLTTGMLFSVPSRADSTASPQQYPVIEVKPLGQVQQSPALQLAGAKNEHLFLLCRFSQVDPASFKIKVVETSRTPSSKIAAAFYQLCWAPPSSGEKFYPDALLPVEQGLIQTGNNLDILVALHLSPDAVKGFLQYDLIATDVKQTFRLPFQVRVYDFSLPDDLPITIFGGFWNYQPDHYAKYGVDSFAKYLQVVKNSYDSMRRYKMNALGGAYFFPFEELQAGKKIEDFQDYHQLLDYALNQSKFRWFMIPKLRGWRTINQPGDDFIARAQTFYPLYQAYLEQHGWQDRALNYLIDEPQPENYPAVQRAYATSKSLAPAIKTLCAGWNPAKEFVQVIDLWATPLGYYNEAQANAARSQGQKQWLYANRLHGIDHPHVHQRLIGWLLYRHQFDGYLLWGVNFRPNDPWTTPPDAQDYLRRGTFYYPHPQNGQPVPTIRLESFRRGLQDYQYLILLKDAHAKGHIPAATFASIDQRVQAMTANAQVSDFPVPMQEVENLRLQIGELLDGVGLKTGPGSPKSPTQPAPTQPSSRGRIFRNFLNFFFK